MNMPKCFYSRAFWIVVPILIASFTSGYMAINAQISTLDDRITDTEILVAESNTPKLIERVDSLQDKIVDLQVSIARVETKLDILKDKP